jgi:hypothetical protein
MLISAGFIANERANELPDSTDVLVAPFPARYYYLKYMTHGARSSSTIEKGRKWGYFSATQF